jgi:cyclopropane fatty-acyl-phospholipid synthase-like methyltransferase
MSQHDADHWDARYRAGGGPRGDSAVRRMQQVECYIEALRSKLEQAGERPNALDVACGAGGALCWLAQHGWQVTGVDVSREALRLTQERIRQAAMEDNCLLRHVDLDRWQPQPCSVHLILQHFYLDRALLPALRDALRPGGLFILET